MIDEAIRCREEGKSETILFNLCGHGYFDMSAYDAYLSGQLVETDLNGSQIAASIKSLDTLQPA